MGAAGTAFTVTVTCESVFENPSSTVTVYVVFSVGDAVGEADDDVNPAGFDVQL